MKIFTGVVPLSQVSDFATPARKTLVDFDDILTEKADQAGVQFQPTPKSGCLDHGRLNISKGMTAGQQGALTTLLRDVNARERDPYEYGEHRIITQLYRELANQFSSRGEPYENGRGVDDYPAFMLKRFPLHYRNRMSALGTHYDWNPESSATNLYTWSEDLQYLLYLRRVKEDGLNKMEIKILNKLACSEVKSAVKAEAVLWFLVLQPLRDILNSTDTDLNITFCDMWQYCERMADLLKKWSQSTLHSGSEDPDLDVFDPSFSAFSSVMPGNETILNEHLEIYRSSLSQEWKVASEWGDEDKSVKDWKFIFLEMCKKAYPVCCRFFRFHLPKGEHAKEKGDFYDPTQDMIKQLVNHPKTNKLCETSFGIFDLVLRSTPNAGHVLLMGLTAARMTKPLEFLRDLDLPKGLFEIVCLWAKSMAAPRKQVELARMKKQTKDKEALLAKAEAATLEREKKHILEWELLRLTKDKEMLKTQKEMLKLVKDREMEYKEDRLTPTDSKFEILRELKRQRKYLFLVGVSDKVCPRNKTPRDDDGRQRDYTPSEFATLLGKVAEDFHQGNFDESELHPKKTFARIEFEPFRGGTATPEFLEDMQREEKRVDGMLEEIKKEAKEAEVELGKAKSKRAEDRSERANAKKLSHKQGGGATITPKGLLRAGQEVWVLDTDPLDLNGADKEWRAITVCKNVFRGEHEAWKLDFTPHGEPQDEVNCYTYGRTRICLSKAEATRRLRM